MKHTGMILLGLIALCIAFIYLQPLHRFGADLLNLLRDQRVDDIYMRTILIAFGTTIIAIVLGLSLSFGLLELQLPGSRFFRTVFFWPLILPPYFFAAAWLSWLGDFGILKSLKLSLNNPGGCVFLLTLNLLPLVVMAVMNGLRDGDETIKEAALLMGNYRRYVWRIWLPRAIPGALGGGALVFVFALNNYAIPSILGVNTLSTEIYSEFGAFYSFYHALLKSVPALCIELGILLIFGRYLIKAVCNFQIKTGEMRREAYPVLKWTGFSLWLVYILLALGAPLLGLCLKTQSPMNIWKSVLLAKDQYLFSLWFCMLSGIVIALTALALAYWHRRRNTKIILPVMLGGLLLPPVFAGIILITVLNRPWLNFIYSSGGFLFLGYLIRFLPMAFILILPAICAIPEELEEASWLSGRGTLRTWQRILGPLLFPSWVMVGLVMFFFCHGEAETSILLYPPGVETVSIRTLSLLHYGTGPIVNGLVLAQIFLLGATALIGFGIVHFTSMLKKTRE